MQLPITSQSLANKLSQIDPKTPEEAIFCKDLTIVLEWLVQEKTSLLLSPDEYKSILDLATRDRLIDPDGELKVKVLDVNGNPSGVTLEQIAKAHPEHTQITPAEMEGIE